MLVLTRKVGESILVDGDIRITVTAVNGDRVRIAFTAPDDVVIHRAEIVARIEAEQPDLVCH
jgi:carbon storage regulator